MQPRSSSGPSLTWIVAFHGDSEVHQATGVIIAQTHTDPDQALQRLVDYAESTGQPLDAVAADVIARRTTFS
ncbi:ANTAR domain-containing protein [Cryobacterium lactosi]|uniref:ANTAR domain-containing protein n=1 Tax=Cryobacterium lactosi TaxID=1259202 RepID=UPI003B97280D